MYLMLIQRQKAPDVSIAENIENCFVICHSFVYHTPESSKYHIIIHFTWRIIIASVAGV